MATLVAVSVYVFSRWGAGALAAFGVVRTLGPALGTPLVTALAGRRSPRLGLTLCALIAGAGTAGMGLLISLDGELSLLLAVAGVAATTLNSLRPVVTALLPQHIRGPAELVATNAAAALLDNVSTLAGPLLAGVALATIGAPAVLWIAAALLLTTAALTATLRAAPGQRYSQEQPETTWVGDVLDGLRTLASNSPVRLVVLLSVSQTLVRGALNVLVVVLAIEALDMGDGGVGLLLGALGVGGLVGFPLARRMASPARMARAFGFALVLWGGPIVAVAYAPTPVLAVVLFAGIGLGNAILDITSDTLLQRLVPTGALPRVLGAFDAALYAGMAVGAVLADRLLSLLGIQIGLLITGLVLPVLAVLAWRWLAAMDRRFRSRDADVALLQIHSIFSPLVMSTVDHLTLRMVRELFAPGETIISKGDEGDRFILIEEGTVEVVDDGELLAVLGPGDGFGEMALLDDAPRNATAVARSAVRARSLRREDFLAGVTSQNQAHSAARLLADERRRRSADAME